ncbi:precorrin-3B C(17)-methyltransferase [Candidatus Methanomassiliicoccus intestinalis]|uniref:precorrin-3B C(17)-methyltransferase n=1 Tax=Candidatus Methanomassiliicoccus intestinalis TaxID=1406512 RepID=UPI0037DD8918
MGKLYVVGFGPGGKEHMTVKAVEVIEKADVVTGYTTYIELLKEFFPNKNYIATPMMREVERCRIAVEEAMKEQTVAMVSSGDSGIYGMAGIIYQVADELQADIEIETVPGVTAASAAASVLGAPLMHDLAIISLSDLMTPLDLIMKRVDCAGLGDMIVCLYNPKSKKRTDYVEQAAEILLKYRRPETPVGIVRNAGRKDEAKCLTTLGELKNAEIDMFSIVIIGNSQTYISKDRMITPRGYNL